MRGYPKDFMISVNAANRRFSEYFAWTNSCMSGSPAAAPTSELSEAHGSTESQLLLINCT
jgi:hypothetical protein